MAIRGTGYPSIHIRIAYTLYNTYVSLGSHSSRWFLRLWYFFNVASCILSLYLATLTCLAYLHHMHVKDKRASSYTWTLSVWRSCSPLDELLSTTLCTYIARWTYVSVSIYLCSVHTVHTSNTNKSMCFCFCSNRVFFCMVFSARLLTKFVYSRTLASAAKLYFCIFS